MRCVICRQTFDFASGETAVVLRHVAYGYDFAHDGQCLDAARALIFAEPDYDCAAFGRDAVRRRVLSVAPPQGWTVVLPADSTLVLAGAPLRFEALRHWALVEYQDGSRGLEGIVRDDEWLDEPGGAEFPQARQGRQAYIGYASPSERANTACLVEWTQTVNARYRGDLVPLHVEPRRIEVAA
jgi:hypothetical protein